MNRRSGVVIVALLALTAAGVGVSETPLVGGDRQDGQSGRQRPDPAGIQTVEAVRRDIKVVIAVDAVTVPLPVFHLNAPSSGELRHAAAVSPAGGVKEGQTLFRVGGTEVNSPVQAQLKQWIVPDGAPVVRGMPVAELRYAGFGLVSHLPPADAYRILDGKMSATANITGGPAGFDCPVLQVSLAKSDPGSSGQASPAIVCAIPGSVRAYADLPGLVAITSGQVSDVLTLPVTAVSGGAEFGEVSVVAGDGTVTVKRIGLGATDGAVIEITSGLEEGTHVLASPPKLVR